MSLHDNHLRYYSDFVDVDLLRSWKDIEHCEDHTTTPAKAGQYSWCYECKRVVNKAKNDNQPDKRFKDGLHCLINQLVAGYDLPNPEEVINSIPVPEGEKSWSFKKAKPGSDVRKFGERMTHLLTLSVGLLTVEPEEWDSPQFDEFKARVEEAGFMPLLKPILDNAGSVEAKKRLIVLYAKVSQTMQTLDMEEVQEYIDQQRKLDQHHQRKLAEKRRINEQKLREAREAHRAEQQRLREIEEAQQEKLRIEREARMAAERIEWEQKNAEFEKAQAEAQRKREEERSFWRQEQEKHEALLAANKAKRLEEERARQKAIEEQEAIKAEKLRVAREKRRAESEARLQVMQEQSKARAEKHQKLMANLSSTLEKLPESEGHLVHSVLNVFGPIWEPGGVTSEVLGDSRFGLLVQKIKYEGWEWSTVHEIRSDINNILNTYLNTENVS